MFQQNSATQIKILQDYFFNKYFVINLRILLQTVCGASWPAVKCGLKKTQNPQPYALEPIILVSTTFFKTTFQFNNTWI